MKIYVGTSGYSYPWNAGKSLTWYIDQGFKTVEVNSTFYRFPFNSMIKRWSSVPESFTFSIKVNRAISHVSKLNNISLWEKFTELFKPIDEKVRFWLIQMPPSYRSTESNIHTVSSFLKNADDKRIVMEFRNPSWWSSVNTVIDAGAVFCSVDAPLLPNKIINSSGTIYLRMHGRNEWYSYVYTNAELDSLADSLRNSGAESAFVYFNNDTGMLENALYLLNKAGDQ